MRKVLTFALIFSGTIFAVFILNIVMYALLPGYQDAVSSALGREEIPVVTKDVVIENEPVAADCEPKLEEEKKTVNDYKIINTSSEDVENDYEPIIINREYHEDCGTGKGYWVLTYEDGTVIVE